MAKECTTHIHTITGNPALGPLGTMTLRLRQSSDMPYAPASPGWRHAGPGVVASRLSLYVMGTGWAKRRGPVAAVSEAHPRRQEGKGVSYEQVVAMQALTWRMIRRRRISSS